MREMNRGVSVLICAVVTAGGLWLSLALPGPAEPGPSVPSPQASPDGVVQVTAPPSAPETAQPSADVPVDPPVGVTPPVQGGAEAVPSVEPTPEPVGVVADEGYDYSQAVPESAPVEEDYFADAVFIGDSRTDGFRLYSGLSQGDYLVKTGLSVFKIEKDQVKVEGKKMTVAQALERKSYGKVYVCLGLNELGMGNDQGYYDHFAGLIDTIRASQSEAVVYIQLLIPVNEEKCAEKGVSEYVNNERIAVYNGLLRQLAQDKQVFLTDPAQVIVDPATGQPSYDMVADGVHFQKGPYRQWLDYLKRHTVRLPEPEPDPAPDQTWSPAEPQPTPEPPQDVVPEEVFS